MVRVMVSEITVIVKNEEKTLRTKHLVYEAYTVSETDPIILNVINETVKLFKASGDEVTSVKIKIAMEVE